MIDSKRYDRYKAPNIKPEEKRGGKQYLMKGGHVEGLSLKRNNSILKAEGNKARMFIIMH